jgi:hypothetical protein
MTRHNTPQPISFEPANLDEHTVEELPDYLDSGRRPIDPSTE